ncbi:MAG: ROK family protein [Hespellia sp.]|nr:ROK family protein [Hespellia sp.]
MKQYFAVDIGGTAVKWAVITEDNEIKKKGEFATPYDGAEALADAVANTLEEQEETFAGMGVSVPGTVPDDPDGIIYGGGVLTFLDKVPFGKMLEERCHLSCSVENDGKSCALGEYSAGALKGSHTGIVLVLGTGIGGGIVIDGKIFKGAHSFAGEFSFICADPEIGLMEGNEFGKACGWQTGLQTLILKEKGLPTDTEADGKKLFEWINSGDEAAMRGLRIFCRRLALQINNLQVILDPEVVAIGGGISKQPILFQILKEEMDAMYEKTPWKHIPVPKVVKCQHGNDANLLGAVYCCKNSGK